MKSILIACSWILLLFFSSCEKDKEFPKRFVFDSFCNGDLKTYSKNGEITDEMAIRNIIKGQNEYFWQSDYQSDGWNVEIEIISDTKAKISGSDTAQYFDLIRKNGILYFQFTDTITSHSVLTNERLKYSPLFVQSFPVMTGMPSIYIPCYYLTESNGELYLPFVSYVEKIYGSTGELLSGQGIKNCNNVFNTRYLNKVQNIRNLIDTIVYQDNKVIFKEK